jgi:hypothetical protein
MDSKETVMNKLLASALLSIPFALAALPAAAQTAAGTPPDAHPGMHGMQHHGEARPFSKPTERVEAKLAYTKTALKITDAQQAVWEAYASRMRQQATEREKKMQDWHARMAQAKGPHEHRSVSVIERMERAQTFHADAIKRIGETLEVQKPLYAALSDEQKKVADVVLAPKGPGMGRHGEGRGRMMRG